MMDARTAIQEAEIRKGGLGDAGVEKTPTMIASGPKVSFGGDLLKNMASKMDKTKKAAEDAKVAEKKKAADDDPFR